MPADSLILRGQYRSGSGRAAAVFRTERRNTEMREVFGSPMCGTFNIGVRKGPRHALVKFPPSLEVHRGDLTRLWYLCQLKIGGLVRMAWILRWFLPGGKREGGFVEVVSRQRLPDALRQGEIEIEVFAPWSDVQRATWIESLGDFKWFQAFDWCPERKDGRPRADSAMVWQTIRPLVKWEQRSVLDIGCHTGYFAFAAAKAGGAVTAVDPLGQALRVARVIGRHIEKQDVLFEPVDSGGLYDVILYLSVQHQWDPYYSQLVAKIAELRGRCQDLFVELIVPSLQGQLTPGQIDSMVGGRCLCEYKHNIRRTRRIYYVKGIRP